MKPVLCSKTKKIFTNTMQDKLNLKWGKSKKEKNKLFVKKTFTTYIQFE